MVMRIDTDEPEIIERVAALDVAKAEVVCCARVPGPGPAADAGGPHRLLHDRRATRAG
jgi:hypothetical protein